MIRMNLTTRTILTSRTNWMRARVPAAASRRSRTCRRQARRTDRASRIRRCHQTIPMSLTIPTSRMIPTTPTSWTIRTSRTNWMRARVLAAASHRSRTCHHRARRMDPASCNRLIRTTRRMCPTKCRPTSSRTIPRIQMSSSQAPILAAASRHSHKRRRQSQRTDRVSCSCRRRQAPCWRCDRSFPCS